MGKVKRLRHKLHIAAKKEKATPQSPESNISQDLPDIVLPLPNDNLFAGLNIDINSLKTKLNDDVRSVKSFKSNKKSENSKQTVISKKDKLKARRDMLMRKIGALDQMKKDLKLRQKRKTTAIIGDTNPLHDALPSLESLLKNRPNIKQNVAKPKKKKGIEKARKRKKELIHGVKIYKNVMGNKTFQKNPLEAISQHVQALVNQEKQNMTR